MSGFECYVFFLCLVVFLMLAGMFGFFIAHTYKMTVRLTRLGEEDDTIKTEYQKKQETKQWVTVTERVISALLCVILLCIFVFSLVVGVQEELVLDAIPSLRVVQSGSMASKYPTNTYLFEHDLNDQFGTFDLILVYKPPSFDELQLYDVVVYEVDGMDIVHRIVGIEEPNENHPDERYFLLQGDAVERPDRFPVHYSQIKAIYRGQHVPFVGSFVFFMQSPAGWLCFLLIVFGMIWASVLERKLIDEKEVRLVKMQLLAPDQTAAAIRERKQAERANKRRQRAEARQAKRAEQKQRRDKAKQEQKEEPKQQEETSEKGDGRS